MKVRAKFFCPGDEIGWDIVRKSADPHVVIEEARAARHLKQIKDFLSIAETIQEGRECADVNPVHADRDQVAGNPLKFRHDHAKYSTRSGT